MVGKSHKIIPMILPLQKFILKAYNLSLQSCSQPSTFNSIEVRVAIEQIQYELDRIAMENAKEDL